MRVSPTCVAFVFVACCVPLSTQAQRFGPLRFSVAELTVDDGLSENNIWSIIQDADGYIWIGSFGGINRYDGYDIRTFSSADSATTQVLSTPAGGFALSHNPRFIWVSSDLGFHRFDRWAQTFLSFPHLHADTSNDATLTDDNVQCLLEDASGTLWVGTGGGLNSYDIASNKLTRYPLDMRDPKSRWSYRAMSLLEDSRRTVWIGTSKGLFSVDKTTGALTRVAYRSEPDSIISLCEDPWGNLWLGTMQGDVFVLDAGRKLILRFRLGTSAYALCIEDSITVWCGTSDGSLLLLDRQTTVSREVQYTGSEKPSHPISSLLKDRSGALWVGTMGRGVKKLAAPRGTFDLFRFGRGRSRTVPPQPAVWSTLQSHDGTVWVGTTNTLCRLDTATGEYREVNGAPRGKQVRAILEDGNNLWLGLLEGGLACWDRKKNRWTRYTHDARNPKSLASDLVYALYKDKAGSFWIGTNDGGLESFDPATGSFTTYSPRPDLKWVTAFCEDGAHTLWLGMWNGGLAKFDRATKAFTLYTPNPVERERQSRDRVLDVHQSECDANLLWLGTLGGGLLRFDKTTGSFSSFTENDGLANNSIYGILEDGFGTLWMSTNKGISRFDPQTNAFTNFDVTDGLQGNEFNFGAHFKGSDGTLYFGGDFGLNTIRPSADVNRYPPEVFLTTFKKFGTTVEFEVPLNQQRELSLHYDEDVIGFEFVGLHFKNPKENQYAYKLEGYNTDWVRIGTKREAGFVNLQPGDYVFNVKTANSDGVWSEPKRIAVHIPLPIWKQVWVYAFLVLLSVVLGLFVYRRRVRTAIKHAIEVERVRREEEHRVRGEVKDDVHDTFAGIVSKISALAKDAMNDAGRRTDGAQQKLNKIVEYAESLIQGYATLQWEYDSKKDTLFDLVAQLKQYGDTLYDKSGIRFSLASDVAQIENIKLPNEWRKELLLLFYEAMNNIAKHAVSASRVILSTAYQDETIEMCLLDNGDGFDEQVCPRKNGLEHMRQRAAKLQGELRVESTKEKGTKICFIGKLSSRRVGIVTASQ